MRTNTTLRRGIYSLGAAATLGLVLAGPAHAKPEPGDPVPPSTRIVEVKIPYDDNALEPVQLGGGILAGMALAGAGMAVASRRQHGHPHLV